MKDREEDDKSKFNAAIATLKRIDETKRVINNAKLNNDCITWFKCLNIIRTDIGGKMNEEERVKCNTYEEIIEDILTPKRNNSVFNLYSMKPDPKIDKNKAKYILNLYQLYLVDLEEQKGMGLIAEDDDEGL